MKQYKAYLTDVSLIEHSLVNNQTPHNTYIVQSFQAIFTKENFLSPKIKILNKMTHGEKNSQVIIQEELADRSIR